MHVAQGGGIHLYVSLALSLIACFIAKAYYSVEFGTEVLVLSCALSRVWWFISLPVMLAAKPLFTRSSSVDMTLSSNNVFSGVAGEKSQQAPFTFDVRAFWRVVMAHTLPLLLLQLGTWLFVRYQHHTKASDLSEYEMSVQMTIALALLLGLHQVGSGYFVVICCSSFLFSFTFCFDFVYFLFTFLFLSISICFAFWSVAVLNFISSHLISSHATSSHLISSHFHLFFCTNGSNAEVVVR